MKAKSGIKKIQQDVSSMQHGAILNRPLHV
jgi:hypothetical protein